MRTPRPRPVPPGSVSARNAGAKPRNNGSLKTGALEAMKEQAMRRAAASGGPVDFTHKHTDAAAPVVPFPGFGWEEVHNEPGVDEGKGTDGEFAPR